MNPETISTTSALAPGSVPATAQAQRPAPPAKDDSSRCLHRYENGTPCRTRVRPSQAGLCLRHFNQKVAAGLPLVPPPSNFEGLSAELLGGLSEFTSADHIRQFLSRLLIQVTKGRVSPRRAAVLAYTSSQLLHSHRAIDRELVGREKSEPMEWDFSDWPSGGPAVFRRAKGLPDDPECAMYKRLAGLAPGDPERKQP